MVGKLIFFFAEKCDPKEAVTSYTLRNLKHALRFYKTPEDLKRGPLKANKDIGHFNRVIVLFIPIITSNNLLIELWLFRTISGGMIPRTNRRHIANMTKSNSEYISSVILTLILREMLTFEKKN